MDNDIAETSADRYVSQRKFKNEGATFRAALKAAYLEGWNDADCAADDGEEE